MKRWLPPFLFVLAMVARVALTVAAGAPYPKGPRADENVYLELAWNLFATGEYGSRVSVTYPPLYPMVVAPLFAVPDNDLRFALIYGVQALIGSAALLLLLPALSEILGRRGGWYALGLTQLFSGFAYTARTAQSEQLFTALFIAATGAVFLAWRSQSLASALGLGVLTGLALATRRTALVLPVSIGLLLVQDLWEGRRSALPATIRRAAAIGIGAIVGLSPELLASRLHGGLIQPYAEGVAGNHLGVVLSAFSSLNHLVLSVRVAARQLAYLDFISLGAPILLGMLLLDRRLGVRGRVPPPLARMATFAAWCGIGLAAMTALHILRHSFQVKPGSRWDVYPRYLDPAEIPLTLAAFALAAWAFDSGPLVNRTKAELARIAAPWLGIGALLAVLPGPTARPRGGRISWIEDLLDAGFRGIGPWVFAGACLVVLLVARESWIRSGVGRLWGLGLAALLSWLICPQIPAIWLSQGFVRSPPPAILRDRSLVDEPRRPLAVLVRTQGARSRGYYEPAFRSDHPVWFLRLGEVEAWTVEHPDGFVLTKKGDPGPGGTPEAKAGGWSVWAGDAWRRGP